MRRSIILVSVFFAGLLLISGCGHLAGNDPEGVTGGHIGGYGSFGADYSGGYLEVVGEWRHNQAPGDYQILTFNSNGTAQIEFFNAAGVSQHVNDGTYFVSGNRIDMNITGWVTASCSMSIESNTLTLIQDNTSTAYERIQ